MPNEGKLLPCRACGANCRVERFSGSHIIGVMEPYMCANGQKFGGDCPDQYAYLSADAWNTRPTTVQSLSDRIDVLEGAGNTLAETVKLIKHVLVANLTKRELSILMGDLHAWNVASLTQGGKNV